MRGLNVLSIGLIGIISSGCLSSPSPYTKQVVELTVYFTTFFHLFHSQSSTFFSVKQVSKIVA